jgi:hypothetical protein
MEASAPELPNAQQVAQLIQTWASARPELSAALRAGIAPGQALARTGLRLCAEGRAVDAAPLIRAAVALEPDCSTFWLSLGAALDRTGAYPEAISCLESISSHARPGCGLGGGLAMPGKSETGTRRPGGGDRLFYRMRGARWRNRWGIGKSGYALLSKRPNCRSR